MSGGEFFGVIYKIMNLANEKIYVGMTKNSLTDRMYGHMSYVKSDSNDMLIDIIMRNRGVVKYVYLDRLNRGYFADCNGVKQFSVEVIDQGRNIVDLCSKEEYWIAQYKSYVGDYGTQFGYNQTKGGESPFIGKNSPLYREIDINLLRELIIKGYNRDKIAKYLGISAKTVSDKTREFWQMNLVKAREHFGGEEAYNKMLKIRLSESRIKYGFSEKWKQSASEKRMGIKNCRYIPIDKDTLKSLILEGLVVKNIAEILQINYSTVYDKMNEFWGLTSIIELRKKFGVKKPKRRKHIPKEELKDLLMQELTIGKIAWHFGVGKSTIYKRIKEYWISRYDFKK